MSRQVRTGLTDFLIIDSESGLNVIDATTHLTNLQTGGRSETAFGGASQALSSWAWYDAELNLM